jgi:hypothetical protein
MKKIMTILVTMLLTFSMAYALPSKQEVNTMAQSGNWNGVLDASNVILQEKPNSALAHYYKSQAEYHLNQYASAKVDLQTAKMEEPSLNFANPQLLNSYEAELTRHLTQPKTTTTTTVHTASTQTISYPNVAPISSHNSSDTSVLWTLFIIMISLGVIYAIYRMFSNQNTTVNYNTTNYAGGSTTGTTGTTSQTSDYFDNTPHMGNPVYAHPQQPVYAQPVYAQPMYNSGPSTLGTVASVAGGVIVGEAVSHALFDHNGNSHGGYNDGYGHSNDTVNNYTETTTVTSTSNDNTFGFDSGSDSSSYDNDNSSSFDSGSDSSSSSDNSSDW